MNHPEWLFWQWLRRNKVLPGTYDRVENTHAPGMPDINGTYAGYDYWIELKVADKVENYAVSFEKLLRPSQRVWWKTRKKQGVNGLMLVLALEKGQQPIIHVIPVYCSSRAHTHFRKHRSSIGDSIKIEITRGRTTWPLST